MTPRAPYNAHCYALPQKRMAQSRRSTWYHNAAMRPVEPAIRCTCEFGTSLNSHNADKAPFRCCCAKGCFLRFANLEDIALKVRMGYLFSEMARLDRQIPIGQRDMHFRKHPPVRRHSDPAEAPICKKARLF